MIESLPNGEFILFALQSTILSNIELNNHIRVTCLCCCIISITISAIPLSIYNTYNYRYVCVRVVFSGRDLSVYLTNAMIIEHICITFKLKRYLTHIVSKL